VERVRTRGAGIVIAVAACSSAGGGDEDSGVETSNATSVADTSTSQNGTDSSASSVASSTSADTTGDPSESTGAPIHFCGLADLKPSAVDPIDSGLGAMQIPPDIAAIQLGNCGCHLADALEVDAPDYPSTGPFDMTTWAGFQALRVSDGMPYHALAHHNVMTEFMPLSGYCNIGGGEGMPPDERATLVEWLGMGAPDGATWEP
jgi:hypothetical protein